MAKITGPIKTWRLKRKTKKKKKLLAEWQVHRKKEGRKAMGLARWSKEGKGKGKSGYYGGAKLKRKTADELLREIKGK